jgi:hypothetical protein
MARHYPEPKGTSLSKDSTQSQSGTNEATIKKQKVEKIALERKDFESFIEQIEKKYTVSWVIMTNDTFAHYLEEVVEYAYDHFDLFNIASFPFKEKAENLALINNQLKANKTNNYSEISILIDHINAFWEPPKQFTKTECKDFLEKQEDIGVYLSDISNLTYSRYRASPFFQRRLDTNDSTRIDQEKNNQITTDSILAKLNQRIISDIIFFSQVPSMSLWGISDGINCEYSNEADRPMCENLKTALKANNKEFILKKFSDNERKYDLDSFYIRYLIGDLDKSGLIEKLCLIR